MSCAPPVPTPLLTRFRPPGRGKSMSMTARKTGQSPNNGDEEFR